MTKQDIINYVAEYGGCVSFEEVERDGVIEIEDVHILRELVSPDTNGSSVLLIEEK